MVCRKNVPPECIVLTATKHTADSDRRRYVASRESPPVASEADRTPVCVLFLVESFGFRVFRGYSCFLCYATLPCRGYEIYGHALIRTQLTSRYFRKE